MPAVSPFPPSPGTTYIAHAPYGDGETRTRTPGQVREVHRRRVHDWFRRSVPAGASREDMIDGAFGSQDWVVRARVMAPDARWPMHGWLLTHPTNGILVYADKPRDGDKGPDYVAPRGGPYAQSRLTWGVDLVDLFAQSVPERLGRTAFPHVRVTNKLTTHAYESADAAEALLVALSQPNLAEYLAHCHADPLHVLPA